MAKPVAYLTRRLPEPVMAGLAEAVELRTWAEDRPVPRERLLREVAEAIGLLAMVNDRIDEAVLAAGPNLRVVSNLAVGYDNLDVPAARRRGIHLGHTPGVLTETTADLAFALILATGRRLVESADYVRQGRWQHWGPLLLIGRDIHHATLGIIGLGRIGREVARRAAGFEMRVLYTSRTRQPDAERDLGLTYRELPELLVEADYVSLHVPLTAATRHLIGAAELARMKPTGILINTTRGPVVDQAALTAALQTNQIGGAGLDVTDPEPIDLHDPLLSLPNVTVLPHIGSGTIETRTKMAEVAAANLLAGVRGEPLLHEVPE